ncbi:MAG TPA: PucR family transcriptional regulator ligand-binding domain-containing protein [Streptosporangiaceae bacterium]
MLLRELIAIPGLGLRVLTPEPAEPAPDRPVRRVFTTDLRDPGRYIAADDLILTGLTWHRGPADSDAFVARLAGRGACALGAGQELLGHIPDDLVAACRRHGLPLFAVPADTSFATITEQVSRRLSGEWGTALTRVLGRHRRLVSAVAEGAGLDALFGVLADDLGVRCRLIAPTGWAIAGTAPPLPPERAARLARGYLAADKLPCVLRTDDGDVTVYPVPSGSGHRATSWLLACDGDEERWPEESRESVLELVADVALERARLDAGSGVEQRLATRVVELVAAGDPGSAELASLARTLGLDDGEAGEGDGAAGEAAYAAVALRLSGDRDGPVEPGRLARGVLGELVRGGPGPWPPAVVASGTDLAAHLGAGQARAAIALVRWGRTEEDFAERVRGAAAALGPGLGGLRIAAGVSGPADGYAGLRVAVEEALSSLRLADARSGRVVVVSADEIDSHVLLLASVPDEVRRSFRERLLGPLLDYDEQHGSHLVPTLEAFLAESGSWQACAALLHVHVNTLRYRIQRIERITGRDLGSLETRVDFFLATRGGQR